MSKENSSIGSLGEDCKWTDLTEGLQVYEPATSKYFMTGEWTAIKPVFLADQCKQCLLCAPFCPDSSTRGKVSSWRVVSANPS